MSALDEIDHAIRLVEFVVAEGNLLDQAAVIEIDEICTFDSGREQCGKMIERVVIIYDGRSTPGGHVHASAYCPEHAELVVKAIKAVRERLKDQRGKAQA